MFYEWLYLHLGVFSRRFSNKKCPTITVAVFPFACQTTDLTLYVPIFDFLNTFFKFF